MITKFDDCHEAYFGLGKILFCKNEISKALEMFELAIKTNKKDPVYSLWAAFACLYAAEDLALWIKEANDYRGYLAWSEVYITRGKTKFATEVLEELIEFYPGNPEGYFRLWSMNRENHSISMEIAGKMFLCCTDFYTLETKMAMILIYSEALFQNSLYLQCFEFLQNEFTKLPIYSVLLYYYGKYVAMSESTAYFGSGIGALQECKRVCIPERTAKINYYMGIFYIKLERHGKASKLLQKANKGLTEFEKDKKKKIINKFIKVIESIKKAIKTRESSNTIYSIQDNKYDKSKDQLSTDVNNFEKSLNEIRSIDPITVSILKSEVQHKILKNQAKAKSELKVLMKEFPDNEEAYFKYWALLKESGSILELEDISYKLQEVCMSTTVPTNSWVESLFKHSEMLVIKGRIEEAIKTLKKVCLILPPLPMPRLNLNATNHFKLSEEALEKLKNTGETQPKADQELDNSLFGDERYSRIEHSFGDNPDDRSLVFGNNIIDNIEDNEIKNPLFGKHISAGGAGEHDSRVSDLMMFKMEKRDSIMNDKHNDTDLEIINQMSYKNNERVSLNNNSTLIQFKKKADVSRTSIPRFSKMFNSSMGLIDLKMAKNNISRAYGGDSAVGESLMDSIDGGLNNESECFSVYSDLKFLYQIGRICAESGKFLEEGILCLDDYINLINFFNPAVTNKSGRVHEMKMKALYLVGLIFYQVKDFEESERFLSQVKMDLLDIKDNDKYLKCEQILSEIFQNRFDLYSEDLIEDYMYPEFEIKGRYSDSLDLRY